MSLTLGRYVVEMRRHRGLSQKQLAERVIREDGKPITPQYLNDIEHDRRTPSLAVAQSLASVLDLDLDYLKYLMSELHWPEGLIALPQDKFEKGIKAFREAIKPSR